MRVDRSSATLRVAVQAGRGSFDVEVGSPAPELVLATGTGRIAKLRRPRVLAFVRGWSMEREKPDELNSIRAQLRGLGAELIVLTETGVWSFEADDDPEQVGSFSDRLAGDVATAALIYGLRDGRDGVFVIDADGVVRFAYRPPKALAGTTCQRIRDLPITLDKLLEESR